MEAQQLIKALKAVSDEQWTLKQQPTLLSALPQLLQTKLGGDYREALGRESLKAFIKKTGQLSGYKLIEHPTQRAKIGLVPASIAFEFEVAPSSNESTSISAVDVQAFARVLSALSDEERKAVMLPATVVAKLLTAK